METGKIAAECPDAETALYEVEAAKRSLESFLKIAKRKLEAPRRARRVAGALLLMAACSPMFERERERGSEAPAPVVSLTSKVAPPHLPVVRVRPPVAPPRPRRTDRMVARRPRNTGHRVVVAAAMIEPPSRLRWYQKAEYVDWARAHDGCG